jgi:hypothetical protein
VIDDKELEDRLRRVFDAVANVHAPRVTEQRKARAEIPRRRPLVATIAVGCVAALVAGVALTISHRASGRHVVIAAPTTSMPRRPTRVAGEEQTITAARSDPALQPATHDLSRILGSPRTFVVNDGPDFVLTDGTPTRAWRSVAAGTPATCVSYMGTLAQGGQGSGIQVECLALRVPDRPGQQAVFLLPAVPRTPYDTTVWAHLPAGTAYVTCTVRGVADLWERPVDGTAAFQIAWPSNDTKDYESALHAPTPILRAWTANGELIAAVNAPH